MSEALTWLTGWRLRELIGKREVSPVEVTEHFLRRIDDLDPLLHAMRHVDNEGARRQARARARGARRGALGLPHGADRSHEHIAAEDCPRCSPSQCDDIESSACGRRSGRRRDDQDARTPVGLFGGAGSH